MRASLKGLFERRRKIKIGLLCFSLFAFVLLYLLFMPVRLRGSPKMVYIAPKMSASQIAQKLKEVEAIRSQTSFVFLAKITGRKLKAGLYKIEPGSNLLKVFLQIQRGETESIWVTIPEGYTAWQIAYLLERKKLGSAKRFMELVRRPQGLNFLKASFPEQIQASNLLPEGNLEGYLFPDTYQLYRGISQEEIIKIMLKRFLEMTKDLQEEVRAGSPRPYSSWSEVIILASLIEKEAKEPEERAVISAVLQNRLRKKLKLQCDATVQYALGTHKERLTYKDLKVESPYNTYKIYGLPPAPICNPGRASIEAAVHPAEVDYLFYVAKPDGSHFFSRTYREHLRAIKQAQRLSQGNQGD